MKTVIAKDILNLRRGIIVHQVNCKKVMGAGLAKQIRNVYPKHYKDYMATEPKLGEIVVTEIKPDLFIIGLYGQDGYGTDKRQTNYTAFSAGFLKVKKFAEEKGLSVYIPYKIGCGLAGGSWEKISTIIDSTMPEANIVVKTEFSKEEIKNALNERWLPVNPENIERVDWIMANIKKNPYPICPQCHVSMEPVWFLDKEQFPQSVAYTGRVREAIDYFICPCCMKKEIADDSFDSPWRKARKGELNQ